MMSKRLNWNTFHRKLTCKGRHTFKQARSQQILFKQIGIWHMDILKFNIQDFAFVHMLKLAHLDSNCFSFEVSKLIYLIVG